MIFPLNDKSFNSEIHFISILNNISFSGRSIIHIHTPSSRSQDSMSGNISQRLQRSLDESIAWKRAYWSSMPCLEGDTKGVLMSRWMRSTDMESDSVFDYTNMIFIDPPQSNDDRSPPNHSSVCADSDSLIIHKTRIIDDAPSIQ